jgi:hypothetical protein
MVVESVPTHSARSVTLGPTPAPRKAGTALATGDVTSISVAVTANVAGSARLTRKSDEVSTRVAPNAPTAPSTIPEAASSSASDDLQHHYGSLSAERHAYADFREPARDGVREHAVQPDRGHDQAQCGTSPRPDGRSHGAVTLAHIRSHVALNLSKFKGREGELMKRCEHVLGRMGSSRPVRPIEHARYAQLPDADRD